MQRLSRECGCMLLILAAVVNVAVGGGKVPYYPRVCVGEKPDQCCQTRANIDFQAICSKQLEIFPGGVDLDSPEAALVAVSLASSITSVSQVKDKKKQTDATCALQNYLSEIGADFRSVKFYTEFFTSKRVDITTAPTVDIAFQGGAMLFAAGPNVYIVFGGVQRDSGDGFPNFPIDFVANGRKIGVTNDLWLSYYRQAFRQPGNDIIQDALELLSERPPPPTKKSEGINFSDRKLYIAGYSAGSVASIYASFDLADTRAVHVYLFGNPKSGDKELIDNYLGLNGPITSAWWNEKDNVPVLPPKNKIEQTQLEKTPGQAASVAGWGIVPYLERLPAELYYRIAPAGTPRAGECVKVQDESDIYYAGCPNTPTTLDCGLTGVDHDNTKYSFNIKACVVPTHKPNNIIRRHRYAFNPACINDVANSIG